MAEQAVSVRESYVEHFGEEQAQALERAAEYHKNGIHNKKGSDPFKWAIVIALGYECVSREGFRGWHGITVPFEQLDEDFEECPECGGEGWVEDDCFEDTCCCEEPEIEHGLIPCPHCGVRP